MFACVEGRIGGVKALRLGEVVAIDARRSKPATWGRRPPRKGSPSLSVGGEIWKFQNNTGSKAITESLVFRLVST